MIEFKKGDKIRTRGIGVLQHDGIFVGELSGDGPWVVHNNKPRGVQRITLAAFLNGNQAVIARPAPDDPSAQEAIVQRALAMEGWSYDPLFFNCEDFANYAQIGVAYSGQVFLWLLVIISLLRIVQIATRRRTA